MILITISDVVHVWFIQTWWMGSNQFHDLGINKYKNIKKKGVMIKK
jgi:hypothetical protein